MTETGKEADTRESVLSCHARFLIESMSQREDHIREISVTLLTQLKDKFPQVTKCVISRLLYFDRMIFLIILDIYFKIFYLNADSMELILF